MTDHTPVTDPAALTDGPGASAATDGSNAGFLDLLSLEDRTAVLERCTRRLLARRQTLFTAGDPRSQVYLLRSARVKLLRRTANGSDVIITLCGAGELVGYSGLARGETRLASAQVVEAGEAYAIDENDFRMLLSARPAVALAVIDLLRRRMESVADSLTDVVSEDVPNRILKLLRRIAQSQGGYRNGEWLLDLRLTHQELGNMIGARRQTVTTAINDMHRLGVLRREQQRIVVAAEAREITMKSAVRSGARAALWASAVAVAALFGVEVSAIV